MNIQLHRRHLQKMLRCFHVTHAIVPCAATPATPDAIQMLPKQFLHCIVRERETRSAHSVRLQFLRNIFSLVCRLALQIWNLQLPRAVLLRAVFMILNWNCAQQLGHYPLAQPLSNLKSHRLLFFFMQMLTVHRASGYIRAQALISNSIPGPGITMDQPIKGLQTLKVYSRRETVNPVHSQVVLVCHFLHARQREPVSVPSGAGSQHLWFKVNQ